MVSLIINGQDFKDVFCSCGWGVVSSLHKIIERRNILLKSGGKYRESFRIEVVFRRSMRECILLIM